VGLSVIVVTKCETPGVIISQGDMVTTANVPPEQHFGRNPQENKAENILGIRELLDAVISVKRLC